MAKKAKAKPVEASQEQAGWEAVAERLDSIEATMDKMMEALFRVEKTKSGVKLKRKSAVPTTPEAAKKARVGRAAKRHGMTYQEWVDRYGFVDRLPEGSD